MQGVRTKSSRAPRRVREVSRTASNQNDFSQGSVSRSILRMALPMTVAQLINILYNIVDRMYLGLSLIHISPV